MVIRRAKEVLRIESEAISGLLERIDKRFVQVVELILKSTGRVVVMGMGKSGLIGRKIASTLTSTGTPSLFLHPGDALLGDLGMVTKEDVVVAISNSGETEEILKLLPRIKRIGAKLIAFTGDQGSTLAKKSDFSLDVGVEREACPMGLSPTASTTAVLAMGDALAMVLLEKRNFKMEDFRRFHPGGSLGKKAKGKRRKG